MNNPPAARVRKMIPILTLAFLNLNIVASFSPLIRKQVRYHPLHGNYGTSSLSPVDVVTRSAVSGRSLLSAAPPLFDEDCNNDNSANFSVANRRKTLRKIAHSILLGAGVSTVPILSNAGADEVVEGPPVLYLAQPMGPPGSPSGSKPYAPPEYLLPAARVKVYVDTTTEVTNELLKLQQEQTKADEPASSSEINTKITNATAFLGELFLNPPSFIRSNDPKRKVDNTGKFLSSIDIAKQKQKEREDRQIEVGIAPRAFEVFELSGERRQWNRLQKQERAREDASEVRRAFNIYTTNLVFDEEKYKFKGTKEEKSKLIRDDKLPTATAVIRSDLDLRDLFRNQVQTSLEDARAEYEFQVKQQQKGEETFDALELLALMKEAQVAVDKWFSFIDEKEAKVSLEFAQEESTNWYR